MDHVPEERSTLSIGTPPARDLQRLKLEHLAHRILTSRRRSEWFERASWTSKTEGSAAKPTAMFLRRRSGDGEALFGQRIRSGLSASGLDCAGCALLTGSDAGNVSSRPLSNLSCISLSDFCACFGSSACLSFGAGLNFSVIAVLHARQANASLGH